jgi:hypothetical protein
MNKNENDDENNGKNESTAILYYVQPDMLLTHHVLLELNFNQQISNQIRYKDLTPFLLIFFV